MNGAELAHQFSVLRSRAEKEDSDSLDTCDSLFLNLGREARERMYYFALLAWEASFTQENVKTAVEELDHATLKSIRKQGFVMKSMFECFDTRHKTPKHFRRVLRSIGQLNDPYLSSQDVAAAQKQTYEDMKRYKGKSLEQLDMVGSQAYQTYLKLRIEELQNAFDAEEMTLIQFHEMRRIFRELSCFAQVLAVLTPSDETYEVYRDWYVLSRELGKIKDDALAQADQNIHLHPDLQRSVRTQISRIR